MYSLRAIRSILYINRYCKFSRNLAHQTLQDQKMKQSSAGVDSYTKLSSSIQQNYFDLLVSSIDIQPGWKILDLGCGTGNGTLKLSQLVEQNGYVVGIDPIAERVNKAKELHSSENISYQVGYGRTVHELGTDFDLVIAGTVMHWLSPEEKSKTYQSVYKSLKPGGTFLFNSTIENRANVLRFLDFFEDETEKNKLLSAFYCSTEDEFKELSRETGFSETKIEPVSVNIPYESLDTAIRHISASWHVYPYDMLYNKLQEIVSDKNNNIDFLTNDEGQHYFHNEYYFVTSYKF